MTSTDTTMTPSPPVAGEVDVRDLDAGQVLDYVLARRRVADRAEADLLAAVVVWVDLHPVTDRDGAADLYRFPGRFRCGDHAAGLAVL